MDPITLGLLLLGAFVFFGPKKTAPAAGTGPNGLIGTGFTFLNDFIGSKPALAAKLPAALQGKQGQENTGQILAGLGSGLGALATGIGKLVGEPSTARPVSAPQATASGGLDASAAGQESTELQYADFAQKYAANQGAQNASNQGPLYTDGFAEDATVAQAQSDIPADSPYATSTAGEEDAAADNITVSDWGI